MHMFPISNHVSAFKMLALLAFLSCHLGHSCLYPFSTGSWLTYQKAIKPGTGLGISPPGFES